MLPNITNGTSFTGAGLYYLHDKRREGEKSRLTSDRVAWTHTINCAADDPYLALNEMMATAAQQGCLKREAGLGAGGRKAMDTVKAISLAWAPDEKPNQMIMVAAAEDYLRHMGWQDHQALLVAHNDTAHPHVHILLSKIHPETGRVLDDYRDQPRSQEWALGYEEGQGLIRCEARVAKYERGESSTVTRDIWESWQELSGDLRAQQHVQERQDASEWDILKQHQRDQRDAFRAETTAMIREARAAVYREVRDEFREEWRDWYEAKKGGADAELLAATRADILERQRDKTAARQQDAIADLRDGRGIDYQALLAQHRSERGDLREDQAAKITRYDLLGLAHSMAEAKQPAQANGIGVEICSARTTAQPNEVKSPIAGDTRGSLFEDPTPDAGAGLFAKKDPLTGLAGGFLGLFDRFADSLTGSAPESLSSENRFEKMAKQRESSEALTAYRERSLEEVRESAAREAYWEERTRERSYGRER